MDWLDRFLEPYRHLDPTGWVGVYRQVPQWAGVAAVVLGGALALFGGRQLFRLVAGPLGSLIAFVWGAMVASKLGFSKQAQQVATVSVVLLAALGFLAPPVVVFFAFGVPSGLLGGQLAGPTDWILGFGPGFLLGGAVGLVLHRPVSAVLSAAVGAWLLVLGAMAALAPLTGAVAWLAQTPVAVLSGAGCVALAGAVFQLFVRPSPEKAEALKQEQAQKRRREQEQREAQKRWALRSGKE